jgi:hypothetical protein
LLPSVVVLAVSAALASVDRPTVRLDYKKQSGAEACPDRQAIEDGVAAHLGWSPFDPRAKRRLEARIGRAHDRLEASIVMIDEGGRAAGQRVLSAERCEALAADLVLAISIAVDPASAYAGPSAEPAVTSEASPPPKLDSVSRGPTWSAGVGLSAALGSAPEIAAGLLLGAGAAWDAWSLWLEARGDFPATGAVPGGQVSSYLLVLSVVPCARVFGPVALCGLGSFGALRATGIGLMNPQNATSAYAGVGARLSVAVLPAGSVLAGLELEAHLDGLAALTRIELSDSQTGANLWTTPFAQGALGLTVRHSFP